MEELNIPKYLKEAAEYVNESLTGDKFKDYERRQMDYSYHIGRFDGIIDCLVKLGYNVAYEQRVDNKIESVSFAGKINILKEE